jgi:hypothetical protein
MTTIWLTALLSGTALLAAAYPYVAKIRHPDQRPLAAYLLFVSVFLVTALVSFNLLTWLLTLNGFGARLEEPLFAAAFLLVIFLLSIGLGTWQARKPPIRRNPPG